MTASTATASTSTSTTIKNNATAAATASDYKVFNKQTSTSSGTQNT
jgi:hypothetical protein